MNILDGVLSSSLNNKYMKLEQQVVSLELAQKLKELGVKQGDWDKHNLFYWSSYDGGFSKDDIGLIYCNEANFGFMENLVSAFTVAELGSFMIGQKMPYTVINTCRWFMDISKEKSVDLESDTEADARAKCLIYLLEQDIIKA